jgi:hypothetical protein
MLSCEPALLEHCTRSFAHNNPSFLRQPNLISGTQSIVLFERGGAERTPKHSNNLRGMKGLDFSRWTASSQLLYGDLLNAMLFSVILPLFIIEVIDRTITPLLPVTELTISYLEEVNLGTIRLRLSFQFIFGCLTLLFQSRAFYKSFSDDPRSRYTALWLSCAGSATMMGSCAALSINNLSHPNEPTLPGFFCWILICATANLSQSFRVKLAKGGANLCMGLVVVYCVPHIYPSTMYVPLLVGITGT